MFAAQTLSDSAFLFQGLELPKGMTFATYAHRGAYPLVVTALLAAVFVLLTLRSGSSANTSPVQRGLLYLFVGQNIALVITSMVRLNIYVDAYGLTMWRLAAGIWMMLVIIGLILIIVRMLHHKTNGWLIWTNAGVLLATLYACCFVNFAQVIGFYNVENQSRLNKRSDLQYICSFGPQSIPVIDAFIKKNPGHYWHECPHRDRFIAQHANQMHHLRAWTLQGWRLQRYLQANPLPPSQLITGEK
jgi:hypothetical protein